MCRGTRGTASTQGSRAGLASCLHPEPFRGPHCVPSGMDLGKGRQAGAGRVLPEARWGLVGWNLGLMPVVLS